MTWLRNYLYGFKRHKNKMEGKPKEKRQETFAEKFCGGPLGLGKCKTQAIAFNFLCNKYIAVIAEMRASFSLRKR